MHQINYDELFQTAVLLAQYKGEKTISPKVIQFAFTILYYNKINFKNAINNAIKYVTFFTSNECSVTKFKKANKLKTVLKKYLDTDGKNIYNCDYRINSSACVYLCGLDDVFDNTHKEQYESLIKNKENKTKNNNIIDEEDDTDYSYKDDEEDDSDYEPEKSDKKTKKKTKTRVAVATI
jgi:hypothetical protein